MRLQYLFFILCIICATGAGDSEEKKGDFAPLSIVFESSVSSIHPDAGSEPCCGSGPLRESPLDLSYLSGKKIAAEADNSSKVTARIEEELPPTYDLRTLGKVPPIRDQGQSGSCWDFSAMKSLESSLLPAIEQDFSENNLKNRVSTYYPDGFDYADGGNDLMAAAYFTRGSGPVLEKLDPYDPYSFKSPESLPAVAQVLDIPMFPGRSTPLDNENIKNGIIQFGCLYTTLLFDQAYYNQEQAAYYNPDGTIPNHAVSIIGWDDGYSGKNFVTEAPGDGAFICANSWGSSFGDRGFFYVSYYDTIIGKRVTGFTASPSNTYDGNYAYDPLGWVSNFGFGYEDASAANIFHAQENEVIEAVGFYVPQVNSGVSIGVYLDPTNGPVKESGPDEYATTSYQIPGYHIYHIENPVSVKKGQDFSIEVAFHTPDYGFPIPVEYAIPGYSSKATSQPGQSWVKSPGGSWSDLTKWDTSANVCIRGYTKRTMGPKAEFYADKFTGKPPLTVHFTDASTGNPQRWLWQFGDGETSEDQNPTHTYTQIGTYTVSLTVDRPGGESKVIKENYISTSTPPEIIVPDDHSLIQAAIDASRDGSTIRVRYGYYPEKLTIGKSITLIGESSQDGQKPIIDAQQSGTPVSITGGGVTIDNFSITGAWSTTAIRPAIAVRGARANILNNWIFENYAGIRGEGVGSLNINGNIIWNSTAEGVYTEAGSDSILTNNTIILTGSAPGIRMINEQGGIIRGNIIAENGDVGLFLTNVNGIQVYDNFFNNTINTAIGSEVQGIWNTGKTEGLNIVRGPYIGGNYWGSPDGSGFSDTHPDLNGDGFCDEPYSFDDQTDNLPLTTPGSSAVIADFDANPKEGTSPLTVAFSDISSGHIETWAWQFGDGQSSTDKSPVHQYTNPGIYQVSLTVSGSGISHTTTKPGFIMVTGGGPDYQLRLSPGWNLITAPMPLLKGSDTAAIFSDVDSAGHSLFTYTPDGWNRMQKDDNIKPLVGYWIYSLNANIIPLYYDPLGGIAERQVIPGWNCIGAPGKNTISAKSSLSSLNGAWIYLIGYDERTQRYDDVIIRGGTGQNTDERLITPGKGYWLFMERASTLQGQAPS